MQVGSHYPFLEANKLLKFDRALAYCMRLNVPSGAAVRFEPGETKSVILVAIAGNSVVYGRVVKRYQLPWSLTDTDPSPCCMSARPRCNRHQREPSGGCPDASSVCLVPLPFPRSGNNLISGASCKTAMERVAAGGFNHAPQDAAEVGLTNAGSPLAFTMERSHYAATFGPTTGDRVRLGDTNLFIQVEKDFAVYGDECKFGGGKVLREGQGQAAGVGPDGSLDYVITNALVVDYTGIYKARRAQSDRLFCV